MMMIRRVKLLCGAALACGLLAGADDPKPLEIYFIDVDGGAATLIITPERESILIDSGWPGNNDRDPNRIVYVLKVRAKLDHLDHLVTTHWHMDHFGGVEGLSKLVEIKHFWDRGLPEDNIAGLDFPDGPKDDDPMAIAYRKASQGKRTVLKPGDRLPITGLEALVLTAGGRVIDGPQRYPHRDVTKIALNPLCATAPPDHPIDNSDNARSLSLLFTFGKFHFLDCGDLTWNIEKKLVCPEDLIGPIDLFQVTHHGMDISNNPALLQTIAPTVAVMDNGPRKGGAAATVHRLREIASIRAAYQLHKNSATAARDNTDVALIANTDTNGGQFIKVTAKTGASDFTVQIGESGASQSFPLR